MAIEETKIEWLAYAKEAIEGQVTINNSFILEWRKGDILSPELAFFKKELSDIAAEKLSRSELEFLKANPEAASTELFLRACQPFLASGVENADWDAIQETIRASVKQFYLADLSKFGPEIIKPLLNDVYFFATARRVDEKELLGFLLFSITPALPFGDVKVINFFIEEKAELPKILMSLAFKILSQTRRIFLYARPTDSAALDMYTSMGFEKDVSPFQDPAHMINPKYLTAFDYRIEKSTILQQIAQKFEDDHFCE